MVDTVKLKHKLILDGILLVLLLVLTNYDLTGGLIHELLGMVMLAGFLVHAYINRRYYGKYATKYDTCYSFEYRRSWCCFETHT